ncbi:MAG: class I SAM-dependent methyltransferase [Veillonellaceae bacterium]|nr:class I SAM-dependent methyltransferase [Veillonellaceae bacterium]
MQGRLATLAAAVPVCDSIADIGTDHAYLPLRLLAEKRITRAIAADIGAGPLAAAKRHIAAAGRSAEVECRRGDGLTVLAPGEVDGVTIAGIGGSLLARILTASPEVLASLRFLVLQPMTGSEIVRRTLHEIGWHSEREYLVEEDGELYEIIYAEPGRTEPPAQWWFGENLLRERQPLLEVLLTRLLQRKRHEYAGLSRAATTNEAAARKRNRVAAEIREGEEYLWQLRSGK